MARDVTMMVLPNDAPDAPPKFLLERDGVWRDLGSSPYGLKISGIQEQIESTLASSMSAIVGGFAPPANWNPLSELYDELHNKLLPESVRNELGEAAQGMAPGDAPVLRLHIDDRVEWIPWEILPLGNDLWGIHFQIARLPIVETGPDLSSKQPHQVSCIFNLLGQRVLENEPVLYDAWDGMFSGLHIPTIERFPKSANSHTMPASDDPTWPTVKSFEVAQAADILHVTCHGGLCDEKTKVRFWTLNLTTAGLKWLQIVPSSVMGLDLRTRRPLVFGNACQSSGAAGIGSSPGNLIAGFGPAFFRRGATAFIGTIAPIHHKIALEFASRFYENLLTTNPRMTIAKALWKTKLYFRDAGTADPTYLFYCLYGPPDTKFIV